ncbi:hypothetical protein MHO82_25620, partial [Vibrio sp. Of7-15]|uniref:hypothetical protein n=1 Tax=Vibrio sp. Of7-15 TaxID=2724879 RepID=UPI001EF2C94E
NDATLKDNPSRLVSFMEHYIKHIKNEPAVMEWEMNLWESGSREGAIFLILLGFFISISGYLFFDDVGAQQLFIIIGLGLILLFVFITAMYVAPECYYHKITPTGVYVYSYKRGKVYREALVKGFLIVGGIAAVVLLFILGPMAFAGSGAGTLGLFKLAAMVKDKLPKEFALPWEAIFAIEVDEHNGLFRKKKIFSVQLQVDMVCDIKNYSEVRNILDHYKMECTQYIKPGRKNRQTAEFEKLMEESEKEIEFVWYFHPRNRYGE